MAWIIKNTTAGTIIISDLNVKFGPHQIRDVDLIGRENAERSMELKMMIQGKSLMEVQKDAATQLEAKLSQQLSDAITKVQNVYEQEIESLKQKQDSLTEDIKANTALTNSVLEEIKAFQEKFPLQIKVFAETLRNIQTERGEIAEKRKELVESGASESEMKTQERILAMKDKKLERNGKILGKTMSQSSEDVQEAIDALDELDIDTK